MIYFNISCTNIATILCGIHFNTTNYTTCEKLISISFYSKLHRDMNKNCDAFVRLLIIPLNPFSHDDTLKCRFEKFLIFIWKGMGQKTYKSKVKEKTITVAKGLNEIFANGIFIYTMHASVN